MSSTMSTALSTIIVYSVLHCLTLLCAPSIWQPFIEMVSKQSLPLAINVLLELFSVLLELLRVGKQFSSFVELLQQEVQELRSQLETEL